MTHEDQADDGADTVAKFRKLLGRRLPQRIHAQIDSTAGMAGLCAVEARLTVICGRPPEPEEDSERRVLP